MVIGEVALCNVCCEPVTERPRGCCDRRCISLLCIALLCIVLYCIVLFCAAVPVVIGEALCNVCCEPVTEILEAAVADIVLYCIVLHCSVLHSIALLLVGFVGFCCCCLFCFVLFCFLLRRGPGGDLVKRCAMSILSLSLKDPAAILYCDKRCIVLHCIILSCIALFLYCLVLCSEPCGDR